jgi:hypothetical protein
MDNQLKRPDRRLSRIVVLVLITGLMIFPATVAAAPRPAANCENISERVAGTSVLDIDFTQDPPLLLSADIWSDEALGGSVEGLQTVNKITPGGVLHFTGLNYYTGTDYGDFVATTKGQVTPNGQLIFTITVIEGGSGQFTAHGTFAENGDWDVLYRGRICVTPSS